MKTKSLVLAAIAVFMLGLATHASGQATQDQAGPAAPSGPAVQPGPALQPGAPVQPGLPSQTWLPSQAFAAPVSGTTRFQVTPFVRATEQYTSNVYLTQNNKKEDWITTIAPGLTLSANEAGYGIDLTGSAGYNWYANQTKEDYWSADGTLNLRLNPTPRLTFRVREYVTRSEEAVTPSYQAAQPGNLLGAYRGNEPYVRNVVEPSLDWQFARDSNVGVYYRNNILRYQNTTLAYENSTENYVRPYITYWFDQRNGFTFDTGFTKGDYNRDGGIPTTPDFKSYSPHGRYTYRFNPQTSVFLDYVYLYQDNDDPGIDYEVNNPSVGITHNFNPNLSGLAQVGYYWMNPSRLDGEGGVTSTLSLTQRDQRTTYTAGFSSGYQLNQFTFENLGFSRFYGGNLSITHLLTQRLSVNATGAFQFVDYTFVDRNDWLYNVDGIVSYQLLRWLNASVRVGWQKDDSSLDGASYDEWHAFFTLTASYNLF